MGSFPRQSGIRFLIQPRILQNFTVKVKVKVKVIVKVKVKVNIKVNEKEIKIVL